MSASRLRDLIAGAFADARYPGDDRLTIYEVAGREFDETIRQLRGTGWRELNVAAFLRGDTPIPDLTPAAFHYYLPAFLRASLNDADVCETLAFYLCRESAVHDGRFAYDDSANFEERLALCSANQRAAVAATVEHWQAMGWIEAQRATAILAAWRSDD